MKNPETQVSLKFLGHDVLEGTYTGGGGGRSWRAVLPGGLNVRAFLYPGGTIECHVWLSDLDMDLAFMIEVKAGWKPAEVLTPAETGVKLLAQALRSAGIQQVEPVGVNS